MACRLGSGWMGWLALMLRQVISLLSLCHLCMWVHAKHDSEKFRDGVGGRACQTRWMQVLLKSHTYSHSEASWSSEAPMLHSQRVCRRKCTCTLADSEAYMWIQGRVPAQKNLIHTGSFQTVHILLGCAPISKINEELLHFTVKQRVGLRGTNGYSLQFFKSVFNNVIDFKFMRKHGSGNLQNFMARLSYVP